MSLQKTKAALTSLRFRHWPAPWRKWALRLAIVAAAYSLAGFFLLPMIIRAQLIKRLPALTQRQAAVRQVRLNPWALSLTVRGLALTETNGSPFASFEEFYANFQLSSIFRWAWTFDELSLKEPRAEIALDSHGRFNFANLLESTNPPAASKAEATTGIPRLVVFNLMVTNGHVGFADATHKTPFRTAYEPINFNLKQFTTRPDRRSPYTFEASSDTGRGIAWAGTVTAQPPGSSGTLRINGVQLPKHAPYLEDYTRAQLVEGALDVAGDYRVELNTNGLDLVVSNFTATLTNLQLKDPGTGEIVLAVPSYTVREGQLDWRARQARIGSIVVSDPAALVRRRSDGAVNLVSLVLRQAAKTVLETKAQPSAPWEFTLADYRLERASVQFEDATTSPPFRTLLKPLSFHLTNFTTRPDSDAAIQAEFTTDAEETLSLTGTCSMNPQRGAGALKIAGLDLKRYQPYLAPFFRGQVASGKTDLELKFDRQPSANTQAVTVSNLVLRVSDLEIKSPGGDETVLHLPRFAVDQLSAALAEKRIHVGLVELEGAALLARREKDGTLNLLSLLASTNRPPSETNNPPAPAGGDWSVTSGKVVFRGCAAHLEDRQPLQPAVLRVDQLSLTLEGFQFPSNAPVATELSARVNATGTVSARATVWPYTPAVDAEMGVAGLELRAFQPWVEGQVKLAIVSGAFGTKSRIKYASPDGAGPKLHFAGELAVTNLVTQDQVLFKEFVRWTDLTVKGIDVDLQPNRAAIEQIRFAGLKTSVIVGPDKTPNFLAILPSAPAQPTGNQTNRGAAGPAFPIQLGELALENASIHFGDESVKPACSFDVQKFGGTVKGLSTQAGAPPQVDLAGTLDEASPFALRGTLDPLARDLSLNLTFTNRGLQLTPFTPYMEKYGGHPLNKGRLSLDLNYAIQQGHLQAANNIRIDQLMLGSRNDSPDATKLPVKLAVALLKDRHGQIALDVPVDGRLDDPQFSVGPIILKVIVNLIAKAATSPFKLLGALVGGGEELSYVEFVPGEARFVEGETNKLEKLSTALLDRPAVNLEIEGAADPQLDRDALAQQIVREQAKTARLQELSTVGQVPADAQAFQVEPGSYERLLRSALVKQYGTNLTAALREFTESGVSTNQPPRTAKPKPASRLSLLDRAVGWLPLRKKNSPKAAAWQQAKADAMLLKQNPEVGALTLEVMEALLARKTEVPADAFVRLMQARANAVQAELLKNGQITAERLFLIAPKPVDSAYRGSARVNLSLN